VKKRSWILFMLFMMISSDTLESQCSDAGICSIGHQPVRQQFQLSLDYLFGKSSKTDGLTFHSVLATVSVPAFEDSRLTFLLPYNSQSGPLGSVSGIGDLTAFWTQLFFSETDFRLSANVGARIALAEVNSRGLPQAYQSGLGTNDLLAGISLETGKWDFSIGYQLSRGRSKNTVSHLRRGDDLLLAAGYEVPMGNLTAVGEILFIKRLHQSNAVTPPAAQPLPIPGSDQTQINLVGRLLVPVSERIHARGMLAVPVLRRDVNIDGLTRSVSLSVGFTYMF